MPIAQLPGDLVATDIVGPFTTSPKGNRYLLTVLDHATAWLEAYPLPTKSAESVVYRVYRLWSGDRRGSSGHQKVHRTRCSLRLGSAWTSIRNNN